MPRLTTVPTRYSSDGLSSADDHQLYCSTSSTTITAGPDDIHRHRTFLGYEVFEHSLEKPKELLQPSWDAFGLVSVSILPIPPHEQ